MINLLPPINKTEIRAARTNFILVRYIVVLIIAIVFLLASMYVTHAVLGITKSNSEQIIATYDTRADVYSGTQAQVTALSASLAESKTLLDQEVRYSKVFVNMAQLMPANTVFGKIDLNTNSFVGTPTTVKLYAKTTADAISLRQNFENSPLFTGVSFQAISESGSGIDKYPVSVDLTFTLTKAAAL